MAAGEAWPDIAGRLEAGGHVLPVRVYFEDTDFSGLVYHASYLRFCERGRSDLLRLIGLSHRDMIEGREGAGEVYFAVTRMEIDFLAPARIDDLLEVRSSFGAMHGARLRIDQEIMRDGTAIVRAVVWVAILGRDGRPRRVSGVLKTALQPFVDAPPRGEKG